MIKETYSMDAIEHYFMLNRYEQVITLVTEAFEEDPENELLWFYIGFSNDRLFEYEDAEYQLLEALRLGYDEEKILILLGNIYTKTSRWQESEEMLLKLLQLNPNNAEAHAAYALLMIQTGHKKKGKLLIKEAMELDPESPFVLLQNYLFTNVDGSNKDQILAMEQFMNSRENDYIKYIYRGLYAMCCGNIKEAKEHFRQVYLFNPNDKNVLILLEDFEVESHPLFAPIRIMDKIGGPAIFLIIGVGLSSLLLFIGLEYIGLFLMRCYIVIALYIFIAKPLIRLIRNKQVKKRIK